jgi:hypothetical protein
VKQRKVGFEVLFNYRLSIPSSPLQSSQRLIICTHTIYVIVQSVSRSSVRSSRNRSKTQQQALPKREAGPPSAQFESYPSRRKASKNTKGRERISMQPPKRQACRNRSQKKNVVGQLPKKVIQIAQVRSLAQTHQSLFFCRPR